jgi:hypothetical protein
MTPLIVAAIPIANDLDANALLLYLKKVLYGLLERKIQVISYACDGTEVERSVQKLLVAKAAPDTGRVIYNHLYLPFIAVTCTAVIRGQIDVSKQLWLPFRCVAHWMSPTMTSRLLVVRPSVNCPPSG